jgi:hypothetical protein
MKLIQLLEKLEELMSITFNGWADKRRLSKQPVSA